MAHMTKCISCERHFPTRLSDQKLCVSCAYAAADRAELPSEAPRAGRTMPIGELASACLRKLALTHLILARDRVQPGVNFLDDAIDALDIADKLQESERRSPEAAQ